MAVSVDPPSDSKRVVDKHKLNFSILADETHQVIRDYGLYHAGASHEGKDAAVPAHVLIDRTGRIAWRKRSDKIQDRPDPADVKAAIDGL